MHSTIKSWKSQVSCKLIKLTHKEWKKWISLGVKRTVCMFILAM